MYIAQSIKPVSPAFFRNDSAQFSQNKDAFHDIFQRKLTDKSGVRPPKVHLTGVLIALGKSAIKPDCKFKLETDQSNYILRMSDEILAIANRLEWEEVTVKGHMNSDEDIFNVEKISLSNTDESYEIFLGPTDLYLELDQYKKTIARKGLIDTAPEYMAS
jgi:hypothetical protein